MTDRPAAADVSSPALPRRGPKASPLLIITTRDDLAADYLITRLLERDLPYYRLNAEDLASTTRLDIRVDDGMIARSLACGGATVDLGEVGCVWYRRALRPPPPNAVNPAFRAFAAAELRELYEGALAGPGIRWVNPLGATELAERKLYQLRQAGLAGLRVPSTLVSNDPSALRAFAAEGPTICKPVSQGLVGVSGEWFAVHTHDVTPDDLGAAEHDDPQGIAGVPTLLQRRVPRGVDVRLTVIGDVMFPVEVHTPPGAPVDWRAVAEGVEYRPCDVPADVAAGCRALMGTLDLVYGAFDFVRTDAGEWVFLEVNPAGEWAWLEVELGLPMRDAFLALFYALPG